MCSCAAQPERRNSTLVISYICHQNIRRRFLILLRPSVGPLLGWGYFPLAKFSIGRLLVLSAAGRKNESSQGKIQTCERASRSEREQAVEACRACNMACNRRNIEGKTLYPWTIKAGCNVLRDPLTSTQLFTATSRLRFNCCLFLNLTAFLPLPFPRGWLHCSQMHPCV